LKEEDNVFLDPARQGQQPLTPVCEVGDQRSIVKTFFVTAGVQNIGIGIAILAFLLASSNFHKMKIPMVNLKSSILV
jgi:hypothetical protein